MKVHSIELFVDVQKYARGVFKRHFCSIYDFITASYAYRVNGICVRVSLSLSLRLSVSVCVSVSACKCDLWDSQLLRPCC